MLEKTSTQEFQSAATQLPPVDPSVIYAEAVLNGETSVRVENANGTSVTYHIGHEFN